MEPIGFTAANGELETTNGRVATCHPLPAIRQSLAKSLIFGGFSTSFALTCGLKPL